MSEKYCERRADSTTDGDREKGQILHQCHGSLLGHTLNQRQMFLPFDQTTSAVAPLVSSSLPNYFSKSTNRKPKISKHAESSNSINIKPHGQQAGPASVCISGKPLSGSGAGLQLRTLVRRKCYYGLTCQQFSLIMEQTHQPVKQLVVFLGKVHSLHCHLLCWRFLLVVRMLVPQQGVQFVKEQWQLDQIQMFLCD